MHIRLWVAGTIASVTLMAIAGCGSSGGSEDRIVFLAAPDGRPDLYVMNPDGSETLRITNSSEMERRAVWSPDGRKIAFTAEYSGDSSDIFVVNADGSGLTRLTAIARRDDDVSWSPDGSRIAFSSQRDGVVDSISGGVSTEIYVMNADGSGVTRLTDNSEADYNPAWSPDGKRIAFKHARRTLTVMNADGSGCGPYIQQGQSVLEPGMVPRRKADTVHRRRLAQAGDLRCGRRRLRGNAAHRQRRSRRTTPVGRRTESASCSVPRGTEMPKSSVMNADGSDVRKLTDNSVGDTRPTWSPDGRRIAFTSVRDGGTGHLRDEGRWLRRGAPDRDGQERLPRSGLAGEDVRHARLSHGSMAAPTGRQGHSQFGLRDTSTACGQVAKTWLPREIVVIACVEAALSTRPPRPWTDTP